MRCLWGSLALAMASTMSAQQTVTVVTREYAFQMPDTLPAGLTTFVLRNEGQEPHEVVLVKIGDHDSLGVKLSPRGLVGGPAAGLPGMAQSNATVMLAAGRYEVLCAVPGVDGVEHMKKGMMKLLTVVPSSSKASAPTSDLTVTLIDYDFHLSHPIVTGRHTLRIVNAASQSHMMMLVKFKPGQTTDSLMAWGRERRGPAPIEWSSGVSALPAGGAAYVNADFTTGRYALLCFLTGPDGKDHFADHAMHKELMVQ